MHRRAVKAPVGRSLSERPENGTGRLQGGGAGRMPGAGGTVDFPEPDGGGESDAGWIYQQEPGRGHRAGLRHVPAAGGTQKAAGGHHVRRRAADACDGTRPHEPPALDRSRRAVDGSVPTLC